MVRNSIREMREKRGMKQGDIAKAVGIPHSLVSMIENGRGIFTRQELSKVAKLFKCREVDLYPREVMAGLYGAGYSEKCICLKCGNICNDSDLVTVGAKLYGPPEDCYPGDPGCPECGSVDIEDLVEFAEEAWEARIIAAGRFSEPDKGKEKG